MYYLKLDSTHSPILHISLGSWYGWRFMLILISGFCLTAFLYYLKDAYWEKKNNKIMLFYGPCIPEIYIANLGA